MSVSLGESLSRGKGLNRDGVSSLSGFESDDFASYLAQEIDGTSRFALEDDTGSLIVE